LEADDRDVTGFFIDRSVCYKSKSTPVNCLYKLFVQTIWYKTDNFEY